MCGLIGFTGKQKANTVILNQLLIANDSRGGHSTGYFDGTNFTKCLGKSIPLHKEVRQLETSTFIGHTRFSTHGARTIPNQHPFQYGEVIGAHNGVVHNYKEVGEEFKCKETEVDSQMIFSVLNKTKHDFKTLGKFTGALATLFQIGDLFYTYRKTNPLWVGRSKNGDVYFSSLKDVLVKCKLHNIYQLKEGRLYVWSGNTVIQKIDIDHDPIASKYGSSRMQWWEYGDVPVTVKRPKMKGAYSGITDTFDKNKVTAYNEIEDERDIIGMEDIDYDTLDEIDITDYDLTEKQDRKKLLEMTDEEFNKEQMTLWS